MSRRAGESWWRRGDKPILAQYLSTPNKELGALRTKQDNKMSTKKQRNVNIN